MTAKPVVDYLDPKKELVFIAGDFKDYAIPTDKQYLLKYFTSETQSAFLRYYLLFGCSERFTEHTGFFCTARWRRYLIYRYEQLEEVYARARKDMDFELIAELEMGKYKSGRKKIPHTRKKTVLNPTPIIKLYNNHKKKRLPGEYLDN